MALPSKRIRKDCRIGHFDIERNFPSFCWSLYHFRYRQLNKWKGYKIDCPIKCCYSQNSSWRKTLMKIWLRILLGQAVTTSIFLRLLKYPLYLTVEPKPPLTASFTLLIPQTQRNCHCRILALMDFWQQYWPI